MNIEGLEIKKNKRGTPSYWKDGKIVGKRCTVCGEDKEISNFTFYNKKKNIYNSECKECRKKYEEKNKEQLKEKKRIYNIENAEKIKERKRIYNIKNAEKIKEKQRQRYKENAEKIKEWQRQHRKNNPGYMKEYNKRYYKKNKEKLKENQKQYVKENLEKIKLYHRRYYSTPEEVKKRKKRYDDNIELMREKARERYNRNKTENIQEIINMLEQLNPVHKQLNLPVYGCIYKITNIKTNKIYIGQTTNPLKRRYYGDIISAWVKEKKSVTVQKFKEELNENDFVIDIINVGCCKYHLDKLEVYYINKYNSYREGYNNTAGNYETNDGIEEFENILKEYNLNFIDGKLIENKKCLPK